MLALGSHLTQTIMNNNQSTSRSNSTQTSTTNHHGGAIPQGVNGGNQAQNSVNTVFAAGTGPQQQGLDLHNLSGSATNSQRG